VSIGDDRSVTVPREGSGSGQRNTRPVLLVVGSAQEGGAARAAHPMPLPARLEIGRAPGDGAAEGRLNLRDRMLSRVHLRLERTPGGCDVEDAGSLNGTFVDGRRITQRTRLGEGSLLAFGGHTAVFRRTSEEALAAVDEELADPFGPVPTLSPKLALTLWRLRRLARSGAEVLLTGETGVGKEVYAHAVHRRSGRPGRLVAINCAAIPGELAESELFGYVRGAHSMASDSKAGLIQSADGGTLFLDEIGDMSPRIQAKLLRFLQDREVTPLGSTVGRKVDVQVVAATNNAALQGSGGDLRSDLAARLGAQAMRIPPLRDRIEDLGALAHHFLAPDGVRNIEPAAFHALCLYAWPRNVRELEKALGEAVAVSGGASTLTLAHLPEAIASVMERSAPAAAAAGPRRAAPSRSELQDLLRQHDGNVAQVARSLGRQWAVVWRWLVKHEIDPEAYRG
jgi:transcriptional regulator with PAS, ATPase and Fis domain